MNNMSEFDIAKHKFNDPRIDHDGDTLNVEFEQFNGHLDGYSTSCLFLDINKQDAAALAKHFKLTEEDLK